MVVPTLFARVTSRGAGTEVHRRGNALRPQPVLLIHRQLPAFWRKRFSSAGALAHTQRQARLRMHARGVGWAYRPRNSLKAAVTCALYLRAARHARLVSFCGCSYAPAARGSRGRRTAHHKGSSVLLPLSVPEPAAAANSSSSGRRNLTPPRSRIVKKKKALPESRRVSRRAGTRASAHLIWRGELCLAAGTRASAHLI
jgi:hypothetical protein